MNLLLRYANILPYDYNRVKLESFKTNDYINASWIKSAGQQSFIAAQGPLSHTVPQFWQMIAENNVTVIMTLTKLTEMDRNGKNLKYSKRQFV